MRIAAEADWSAVARGWARLADRIEGVHDDVTGPMLEGAGPLAGRRVLELGAGPGTLASHLAEAVGPDGTLVASDLAEGMVEVLRERVPGTVDVQRIDAAAIPLPDASVDAVLFRMGLMLVPEPELALAEIHRVLRPGGRLALAVWGDMGHNPWLTSVGMSAAMTGLVDGPPVGPGGPFSLGDPADLEQRVRDAGFDPVTVTVADAVRRYDTAEEHLEMVCALAPPLALAIGSATQEQQATLRRTVAEITAQYRDGEALILPSRALVCVATRP